MRPATAEGKRRRRRRRLAIVSVLTVLIAGFGVATMKLLVWPAQGMPASVDAIVMMNGPGGRLDTALALGWEHKAPMLVISRGAAAFGHSGDCAPRIPKVTVICFDPQPSTTQGEAEFFARLARRYHWKTVTLVTITPQITPGRIWLRRCLPGVTVYAVAAPLHALRWLELVPYEWGALLKAELLDRSC
jgi:hypothetical protein